MWGGEETEETIKEILKIEMTATAMDLEEVIHDKEYDMKVAANKLDFETAALLRDELDVLKKELAEKKGKKKGKKK
jgi:excinuclease UvrABC helicase subunit UvrB